MHMLIHALGRYLPNGLITQYPKRSHDNLSENYNRRLISTSSIKLNEVALHSLRDEIKLAEQYSSPHLELLLLVSLRSLSQHINFYNSESNKLSEL